MTKTTAGAIVPVNEQCSIDNCSTDLYDKIIRRNKVKPYNYVYDVDYCKVCHDCVENGEFQKELRNLGSGL